MSEQSATGGETSSEVSGKSTFSIDAFRKLVASLPEVSKEVALKIAEQLPELRKIATSAVSRLEKMHKRTLDKNEKSQEHVHEAFGDVRRVLENELNVDDLSWEQRKEIYELLMDTADKDSAKDTENKRLLDTWLKAGGVVAIAALVMIVILAGGKTAADSV